MDRPAGWGGEHKMNACPPETEENSAGMSRRVAALGASANPQRYSHMAIVLLKEKGFPVVPIHPALEEIQGLPVVKRLADIQHEIHALRFFVSVNHLPPMIDEILQLAPRRVIFNPGTESVETNEVLSRSGIECSRRKGFSIDLRLCSAKRLPYLACHAKRIQHPGGSRAAALSALLPGMCWGRVIAQCGERYFCQRGRSPARSLIPGGKRSQRVQPLRPQPRRLALAI
jgi:predicted CoA-binding protein